MGNGARSSVLKQRRRALLARTAAITVARYGLRKNGFVPTWPKSSGLNYVTRPQRQRRFLNSASGEWPRFSADEFDSAVRGGCLSSRDFKDGVLLTPLPAHVACGAGALARGRWLM